jgi:sugar-phosphatase
VGSRVREFTASELLFDLDGTLIDSIAAVEEAWQRWAAAEGVVLADAASFHGRTADDLVSQLLPAPRVRAAVARLSALEQSSRLPVVATRGAVALLHQISPERLAIVTSATRAVALARLAAAGLQMPSLLITADDVSRTKPDPEPFLAGRRWSGDSAPAVAFEDTVAGLRAAKAAGCITIGIVGTEPAPVLATHADVVVSSLEAVTAVMAEETITLTVTPIGGV